MNFILLIALCRTLVTGLVLDSSGDPLLLVEQERQARIRLEAKVSQLESVVNRLDSSVSAECALHCPMQKSVGFMAQLSKTIDNPAVGHVVVFDDVITNVGNAYNNVHGIFTAPVNGTYSYSLVVSSPEEANVDHALHLYLKHNQKSVGYVFLDRNTVYWLRRTTSIVLDMTTGDELWVEVGGSQGNHVIAGCCFHTHFSGFLISTD